MATTIYTTIYEKPVNCMVEVLHIQRSQLLDTTGLKGTTFGPDTKGSVAPDDFKEVGMEIFLSVEEAVKFYEKKYGLPLRILYYL